MSFRSALGFAGLLAASCTARSASPTVAPPLEGVRNAFESAARPALREQQPEEHADLANVYHLSPNVISGGEPQSEAAFRRIAGWGVRTILSVDGKVPDAAAAQRHGMRSVHVPIQYKGITQPQVLALAKTFRELEGPFFVHCFHGRHRGPAAAAVGRLVLDGVSREQAMAEMRQWCGTSGRYEGLYLALAAGQIPGPAETAAAGLELPATHPFGGLRGAMVGVSRAYDQLEALVDRTWEPDPAHPDVDPTHEATKLQQLFQACVELEEVRSAPARLGDWMDDSVEACAQLVRALEAFAGGKTAAGARADAALERVAESCSACHGVFRDN